MVKARAERGRDDDDDEDGGHKAAQATHPKRLEVDTAVRFVFDEQQSGDEEAGQDEEHRHALHATWEKRGLEVVEHDCGDSEGANAIERGDVAIVGALGRGRVGP